MKEESLPKGKPGLLRQRAEEALKNRITEGREETSLAQVQRISHELQVHQIELE
jgi:hypothetical protein